MLEAVTIAHGGSDRWDAVRSVGVTFNFSGGLLDLKGFPGHHRPTASVDVRQPCVVMQRLGGDPDDHCEHADEATRHSRRNRRNDRVHKPNGLIMTTYTHQTAPTQFVEANGIRFAYRRFGKTGGVPLVFRQQYLSTT